MKRTFFFLFIGAAAAGLLFPIAAQACAVCVSGASPDDRMADAFNWSVLFLMSTPYTIMGSVAGWIFYAHRRAARKRDAVKRKAPVLHAAWAHKESGR